MADITRYHANTPDWRRTDHPKSGILIGIELEVFHPDGKQYAANVLDEFDPGEFALPLAENDSSLCSSRGVELICPPMPIDEAVSPDGYVGRLMDSLKKVGTKPDPSVGYGLHININVADWSEEEKQAVQYLLNRFSGFGLVIGGRATGFGSYHPVFYLRRQGGGRLQINTYNGDKHCAAWLRRQGRVMEVRFPKSTLDINKLKQAVDYVFALHRWVSRAPKHTLACCFLDYISPNDYLAGRFYQWCCKHRPEVASLLQPKAPIPNTPYKGGRLKGAQQEFTETSTNNARLMQVGIHAHGRSDSSTTEQSIRISNLIGKSTDLEGELAESGRLYAPSIRIAG